MKLGSTRQCVPKVVVIITVVVLILVAAHIFDLLAQYRTYDYFLASVSKQQSIASAIGSFLPDKVIVIGKLENEDTSWVERMLPE